MGKTGLPIVLKFKTLQTALLLLAAISCLACPQACFADGGMFQFGLGPLSVGGDAARVFKNGTALQVQGAYMPFNGIFSPVGFEIGFDLGFMDLQPSLQDSYEVGYADSDDSWS